MIHSLFILNRAGGLIYQQDYSNGLNKLSINDYLVFAGTIHGVHAIASKLTPPQVKNPTSSLADTLNTPKLHHNHHLANTTTFNENSNNENSSSRLNQLISNFASLGNAAVTNVNLLSNSSISYNKLNSNFFYMNSNLTGMNTIETSLFNIFIFQTLTGIKFILIASPNIHEKPVPSNSIAGGATVTATTAANSRRSYDSSRAASTATGAVGAAASAVAGAAESSVTSLANTASSLSFVNSGSAAAATGETKKTLNTDYEIAEDLLRKIYVVYSDYVMKNPFYSMDMPIKTELFDNKVKEVISGF